MTSKRAKDVVVTERRAQAVQMRLAGVDWATIATRLGYSDKASAHKDVTRALEAARKEMALATDELRHVECERLDRMQAALWPKVLQGDTRAIDTTLRLMARRANLLGLDMPVKVDLTQTTVSYNIVGVDMTALR